MADKYEPLPPEIAARFFRGKDKRGRPLSPDLTLDEWKLVVERANAGSKPGAKTDDPKI